MSKFGLASLCGFASRHGFLDVVRVRNKGSRLVGTKATVSEVVEKVLPHNLLERC